MGAYVIKLQIRYFETDAWITVETHAGSQQGIKEAFESAASHAFNGAWLDVQVVGRIGERLAFFPSRTKNTVNV